MNIEYNGYKLEVITKGSVLIGNCNDLGYTIETPNGYNRLISKFQETVDDHLKLQPYIQDLDVLAESKYSDNEVDEKLNQLYEQYSNLGLTILDIRRDYDSRN
jgi:hypothetical protein